MRIWQKVVSLVSIFAPLCVGASVRAQTQENQRTPPDMQRPIPDTERTVPGSPRSMPDNQRTSPDTQRAVPEPAQKAVSDQDRTFIEKATRGNLAEIKVGGLAVERGSSKSVRDFGQRLVDDHTKANEDLRTLAREKGVDVPTSVSPDQKAVYDRLSKLSGREFDQAFMKQMASDHKEAISLFNDQTKLGTDRDLKSFANRTLSTLKTHQNMAERGAGRAM